MIDWQTRAERAEAAVERVRVALAGMSEEIVWQRETYGDGLDRVAFGRLIGMQEAHRVVLAALDSTDPPASGEVSWAEAGSVAVAGLLDQEARRDALADREAALDGDLNEPVLTWREAADWATTVLLDEAKRFTAEGHREHAAGAQRAILALRKLFMRHYQADGVPLESLIAEDCATDPEFAAAYERTARELDHRCPADGSRTLRAGELALLDGVRDGMDVADLSVIRERVTAEKTILATLGLCEWCGYPLDGSAPHPEAMREPPTDIGWAKTESVRDGERRARLEADGG